MNTETFNALQLLLTELLDGSGESGFVLNPGDDGLLRSLKHLSAEQASARPANGASIAAHVDHLRYGFELLNRWSAGEEPFAEANYSASWGRTVVTESEWAARIEALRHHAHAWRMALDRRGHLTPTEAAGVIASVVHLAYHLGAIRQIDRTARGPAAQD